MNKNLILARKIYFSFMFSSFIFFALLILIIGKNLNPFIPDPVFKITSFMSALIPAGLFIYRWKSKKVNTRTFFKLSFIGYIPVIVGFIISILYKNYLYFVLLFPVFFLSYLVIVPTKNFIEE